jgi:hypothetical protein
MTVILSSVALVISIGSVLYSIWKDTQATIDAGNAWRAKRRLEEAIVTHLRTLKAELRLDSQESSNPMKGRFLALATEDLRLALAEGKAAGLPRVLLDQRGKEENEDFLTEWIMIERHVEDNLTRLPRTDLSFDGDPEDRQLSAEEIRLDPGQGVMIIEGLILARVAPLSRHVIRRSIRRRLSLTPTETEVLQQLAADHYP